jgi:hypothetical protein
MPVIKEQANNRLSGPLRLAPGYRMPPLGNAPLFIVKRRFSLPVPHPDPRQTTQKVPDRDPRAPANSGRSTDDRGAAGPQGRVPPRPGVMGPIAGGSLATAKAKFGGERGRSYLQVTFC